MSSLNKKRIPTLVGLVVLVAGLGAGLFVVGRATIIPRASAEETPKEIKITNITDDSFTVSWITDLKTNGFVRYGLSATLDQTIFDDRDQLSGEVGSFLTHHVTLQNLKAGTEYFFKLGSGTRRVLYDNSGQPYAIKTASKSGTPPAADTVYGTVVTEAGVAAEGAIVYLTLPSAAPLSALVKAGGNWAMPLSASRTQDLTAYATYDRQTTTVEIFVQGGSGKTATAVTVTANDSPVPQMTLGQAHDFRSQGGGVEDLEGTPGELPPGADLRSEAQGGEEAFLSTESTQSAGSKFSFVDFGPTLPTESTYELDILNPEREGEQIATNKPEIFGTSPANVTLTITVESPQTYTDEVDVDEDGLWQWTPPTGLTPGEHTVTASYTDENGILQQVKRKFVVAAATGSGSAGLPTFEATPSATASPSAGPRVSQPSTASGVPAAGVLTPTIVIFILGLGLLGIGLFWQLQYRKLT